VNCGSWSRSCATASASWWPFHNSITSEGSNPPQS
jgi:hypothetical protein